jgi:hypothetical protein
MTYIKKPKIECDNCKKLIGGGAENYRRHLEKCNVEIEDNKLGENNMALFVEVDSLDKACPVIINLEHVTEIAPLVEGGCALFLTDSTGKTSMRVSNSYDLFKQFAMQTVSADDIADKIAKLKGK